MSKMPSVMKHNFSMVPQAQIPRSVFDRTHAHKTTFDSGYLVPFYVDEALPGDTFNVNATIFARLSTPIVPFMDNLWLDTFYFAVPNRLIWANFKKFCGEQTNPGDSTSYTTPQIVSPAGAGWIAQTLFDYFGIPINIPGLSISALWSRAYNLIWNEWFRDQNLQNSVVVNTGDAADTATDYVLLKRGKRHDYFTSALPWPQKGTAVTIPLGTQAEIKYNPKFAGTNTNADDKFLVAAVDGAGNPIFKYGSTLGVETGDATLNGRYNLYADLTNATASSINSLRQAFQIQRLYERDARGGTRYTEIVRSHFGVTSPDARLQRPEFLGGNTVPVLVTPVPSTNQNATFPQGHLAGFGTVACNRDGFSKSFTEHCVIIGLMCIRADLTYQQGIPKMFLRSTRWDYFWPALAHLGEQTILNKEIYAQGTGHETDDNAVFGYQERWAEYRYFPSKITGKLRSTYSAPLDVWHLAQKFTTLPTLSSTFIVENPPIDRVVAVNTEPQFVMDSFIQVKSVRPMPVYSVPGLIDHF